MDDTLQTRFAGSRGRVFWPALRMGGLTVLTLGIYRFWMKTRLRRIYWSSVRPGGAPMEYVGQPIEKLLGFLIAVVILAFYIGVVNLVLMYFSFSLFQGNAPAYLVSVAGVIPLWFYARYRARRYVVGRTRWRGIRFGVDPGAWGYAVRAMGYWLASILSLGLLWPLMTYRLEKYRADRTWYGTARISQGGRWTMLIGPFVPVWLLSVGLLAIAGLLIASEITDLHFEVLAIEPGANSIGKIAFAALVLWPLSVVLYSVESYRRLTNSKSAGALGLSANPRIWRVALIYLFGYLAAGIIATGLSFAALVAFGAVFGAALGSGLSPEVVVASASRGVLTVLGFAMYFGAFVIWGALRHAFVTLPIWRHYATTTEVTGADALRSVRQRARDEHTEAEGFAEALDLGAAI